MQPTGAAAGQGVIGEEAAVPQDGLPDEDISRPRPPLAGRPKVLSRPQAAQSDSSNGHRVLSRENKSLEQKQEEYAAARARIFGPDAGTGLEEPEDDGLMVPLPQAGGPPPASAESQQKRLPVKAQFRHAPGGGGNGDYDPDYDRDRVVYNLPGPMPNQMMPPFMPQDMVQGAARFPGAPPGTAGFLGPGLTAGIMPGACQPMMGMGDRGMAGGMMPGMPCNMPGMGCLGPAPGSGKGMPFGGMPGLPQQPMPRLPMNPPQDSRFPGAVSSSGNVGRMGGGGCGGPGCTGFGAFQNYPNMRSNMAQQRGPYLPRQRVQDEKILGKVLEWKGKYGWIQAFDPLNHAKANKHQGKIFLSMIDVVGADHLDSGDTCEFYLFEDADGLGAEECMKVSDAGVATPPSGG
mmetsp:Transcript_65135/g.121406  ORF Transcript_65135/g.121406 Transcript_65135/m.121406 type:complete len:404 (+) Transcript_65135:123-1334(+)